MQGDPIQAGVDTEVVAGSRKKERTKKERARSMRKMKAHVGAKNKEEKKMKDKKMKAKETPKVDDESMPGVLGTIRKGYDGPHFSEVLKRVEEEPSGKKKEVVVVRLNKELLDYMSKQTYPPPPSQPFRFTDSRLQKMEEEFFAQDKAACEARDNILKQYKDLGYAEMLLSATDDD